MVSISKERKCSLRTTIRNEHVHNKQLILARGGTSWDRSLELTDGEVLKEALMSSEKTKTATTKKTLKPFFVPSHLTSSFLLDSDF